MGIRLNYFIIMYFAERPSAAPRKIYPFVASVQFRLCSLIHAARQNADPKKESFTINYADSDLRSTFHQYKVYTDHAENKFDKREIRTLGCAINRKAASDIAFFLYYDNGDPNAVFALELKEQNAQDELHLTEHFRDLNLPIRAAISF